MEVKLNSRSMVEISSNISINTQINSTQATLHPLFNPLVLDCLFDCLDVFCLKSCRLVCHQWNKSASPFLQQRSQVVLFRGRNTMEKHHNNFRKFVTYILGVEQEKIFFRNYHIEHWIMNETREKNLKVFWQKCGPLMKELHFKDIIFYEAHTIRNILFNWTPHLELISLNDCLFYTITGENIPSDADENYRQSEDFDNEFIFFDYYDHVTVEQLQNLEISPDLTPNPSLKTFIYKQLSDEPLPLSWREVFIRFPNIQKFIVSSCIEEESITMILQDFHRLSNLTSLEFTKFPDEHGENSNSSENSKLHNSHLELFCKLPIRLTSLSLHLRKSVDIIMLRDLLQTHQDYLKQLTLLMHSFIPSRMLGKNLSRSSNWTLIRNLIFPKIKFLTLSRECPFLSLLSCSTNFPSVQMVTFMDGTDIESQRAFKFSLQNGGVSPTLTADLCQLANSNWDEELHVLVGPGILYCAAIKRIEICLDDFQIRIIFENIKNLEILIVLGNQVTDKGLTGEPMELSTSIMWSAASQRLHPYIGCLKRLKRFEIRTEKRNVTLDAITNDAVYHGIMDCLQLTHLELPDTFITRKALQELAMKSSLITLMTPTVRKGYMAGVECTL